MKSAKRSSTELDSRLAELTREFGEAMTLDGLTRDFSIFQRRRGHRHSTDDLLTAWYGATHAAAPVRTMLDLGTGIGSVGLALAWYWGDAMLTAIEVQDVSFNLLRENIWANQMQDRVRAIHGDLRESVPDEPFDLVTGSPPYFDVRTGIVSADPQRAGARFELCGDVSDYCRAAVRALSPAGRFVFCFPTVQTDRAERACKDAELAIVAMRDVVPKEGVAPLFSLYACARDDASHAPALREPPYIVRDRNGVPTAEHVKSRALFGMTDRASEGE
jgi:tRNA1Val (adenine37-N6)-methyltransferase